MSGISVPKSAGARRILSARFGREPEGIWLAETAIDYPTLEALADEGFKFTILAPSQAQRCRPLVEDGSAPDWHEVGVARLIPPGPYRCFLPSRDAKRRSPLRGPIFFYDGPISRDMGFNDVLAVLPSTLQDALAKRCAGIIAPISSSPVATDGETFGHHRGGAEKTLAYAVTRSFPEQGWTVTNFAHYLHCHSPHLGSRAEARHCLELCPRGGSLAG
jgi:alpha-amylase/alpha-mannosidase (GH57 family)